MGGIFGGGDTETKVTQTRDIPPPTRQETQLLNSLFNLAYTDYYRPSEEFKNVLSTYYRPSEEFIQVMRDPYLSMLPYQEKWGEFLNQFAARGVVDSTITQNAMKELGQALAERARELKTSTLAMLEEAQRQSLEDQLRRATMLEEAQRLSTDERYRNLFNLWSTLYSGRMGTATITSTQTGTGVSPFASLLGQAAGLGLGWWLGPGGGLGTIGSALGSLFGGSSGATLASLASGVMPSSAFPLAMVLPATYI